MVKLKTYLANPYTGSFAPSAHMCVDLKLNLKLQEFFSSVVELSKFAICAYFRFVGPSVHVYNEHKSAFFNPSENVKLRDKQEGSS